MKKFRAWKHLLVLSMTLITIVLLVGCVKSNPTGGRAYTLPTPASMDVGTVGGILIRDIGGKNEPMANAKVYLANVLYGEDGTPLMATTGDNSPMAVTDENGVFLFTNVSSGTYGLAISTPIGSFLIRSKEGNDFLFNVESGAILDLGEVHTDLPY